MAQGGDYFELGLEGTLSGSTQKAQFEKTGRCASGEFGRWRRMEVPVGTGIPDQGSSAAKVQERQLASPETSNLAVRQRGSGARNEN